MPSKVFALRFASFDCESLDALLAESNMETILVDKHSYDSGNEADREVVEKTKEVV